MDGSHFHLGGKFVKSALPAELPRTVSVFICRPQFSCSPSLSTSPTAHLQCPLERHWRHPHHVWSRYPVLFLRSRGHPLGHPSWSRDPACCPLLSWSCSHKSWDKTRPGETPQEKGRAGAPPRGRVFPRVPAFSSSVYAGCAGLRFPQPMSLRMPSKLTCAWEPGRHVFPGRGAPAAHLLPSPTPTPPSPPADGTGTATSFDFFCTLALLILPSPHPLASSENGREGRHTSPTVVTGCTALGIFALGF